MKVPLWLKKLRGSSGHAEMSFLDHLDELRSVLLSCLIALLMLTVAAWFATAPVMDYLVLHVARLERAVFIKPMEAFTTRVKIALLMAFIAGLPYIGYQIWSFIVPGLLQREKRIVFPLVFWSTILFIIGVGFATFALSPTMLVILRSFGTEHVQESLAIAYLLDFLVKMAFACGILFQLPLVVAVLSFFGLVTPELLKSKWRHAIVIILFIAAVVTPGDGPSQLVLAVPIILLYFISIWISAVIQRGRREEGGVDLPAVPGESAADASESGESGADDYDAEESGARKSGADASDAEESGARKSDAEESGARKSDAEESGTDADEADEPNGGEGSRPGRGRKPATETSSREETVDAADEERTTEHDVPGRDAKRGDRARKGPSVSIDQTPQPPEPRRPGQERRPKPTDDEYPDDWSI